jgi:hypothetical protein
LLLEGRHLLNCLLSCTFREAAEEEERKVVRSFCEMLCRRS